MVEEDTDNEVEAQVEAQVEVEVETEAPAGGNDVLVPRQPFIVTPFKQRRARLQKPPPA